MKKTFFTALFWASAMALYAQVPAFPGAEGFARYTTTGGRGGKVIHVTNLNNDGPGSLRQAIATPGKRIIVFDVAGYIDLESDLKIEKGDVTIAGQTAPGDGITLRHYTFSNNADNVIVRFIRVRRGNAKNVNDGADAFSGVRHSNIIIDHCSMSWSIDETASFYDNNNFTLQWCTIGESLNNAGHDKGAHGYGGIWGGKGASFHHNLLIHHTNRNPRFNGARYNWQGYDKTKYANTIEAERVDLRNCVMYNWGEGNGAYGAPGGGYHNIINNYYKYGPATKNKYRVFQCSKNNSKDSKGVIPDNMFGKLYVNGNYVFGKGSYYDWKGVIADIPNALDTIKLVSPTDPGIITTHTAEKAYEKVLAYAGASHSRDAVDSRYANETKTGTTTYTGSITKLPGIIDTQNDVGGWPALDTGTKRQDTDNDGIPDAWENANGLNANDASDASTTTIDPRQYYTNIEVYCNSLIQDLMIAGNSDATKGINEYYPPFHKEDGTAVTTSINNTNEKQCATVDTTYYNLKGCKAACSAKGNIIKVDTSSNGKTTRKKIIKR